VTSTELWGPELYGDPCQQCGFDWSITSDEAIGLVAELPRRFSTVLEGSDGSERHPELGWSAVAYTCHVTDNLRIWAERIAGARLSGVLEVAGYDQDLLAQARHYDEVALSGALWSLSSAVELWLESVRAGLASHVVLNHATRGRMTIADVTRANGHDGSHHVWDVRRIVEYSRD